MSNNSVGLGGVACAIANGIVGLRGMAESRISSYFKQKKDVQNFSQYELKFCVWYLLQCTVFEVLVLESKCEMFVRT